MTIQESSLEPDQNLTLIDSHCHFDFDAFDNDRQQLWAQCQELGMHKLLIPGVSPEQWTRAADLCECTQGLVYAAGLHPWWLEKVNIEASALVKAIHQELQNPLCKAIGECGLDALMDLPIDKQLPLLNAQLALAKDENIPIILHCVKAHNPMIRALKDHALPAGGVVHAYSGSYEQAMQYWKMGFYLGIGGTITYSRAQKTRDAVSRLPLEALLLESDAPDMPLEGHQGERNTPLALVDIARTLAELRNEPVKKIAQQAHDNANTLFNL